MKKQQSKKPIFIRNDFPLPMVMPVEFDISLSVDRTKITDIEYWDMMREAYTDASEAWLLKQANDIPDGHYATTYFTKKEH